MKLYQNAVWVKQPKEKKKSELEIALDRGANIIAERDDYVTVGYPKMFNWPVFIILLLFGAIPGLLYVACYVGTEPKERTIMKKQC